MGSSGLATVSGEARAYVGSASTTGYLFYQDPAVLTDDGTVITGYLDTKRDHAKTDSATIKRMRSSEVNAVITGNTSVTFGAYWDESVNISQTWPVTLDATEGFILGVSLLGVGILGSGAALDKEVIGINRRYGRVKFRVTDSNALRTRYRNVIHRGSIVAA